MGIKAAVSPLSKKTLRKCKVINKSFEYIKIEQAELRRECRSKANYRDLWHIPKII